MELAPLALIAGLTALVPTPKRHTVRYFGVLSSHAQLRSQVVPVPPLTATPAAKTDQPPARSRFIPWAELLRRTFTIDIVCPKCQAPLRLIALIKSQDVANKILTAMHPPSEPPELHPARPPPGQPGLGDDWLN